VNARRSPARRQAAAGFSDAAPAFAALGDATRLSIVARLCSDGPLAITRLAEGAAVSRQAVSKHLRTLEQAGLVRSDRAGRECIWALQTGRLHEIRRHLAQISDQWDTALERLRLFVESPRH